MAFASLYVSAQRVQPIRCNESNPTDNRSDISPAADGQ